MNLFDFCLLSSRHGLQQRVAFSNVIFLFSFEALELLKLLAQISSLIAASPPHEDRHAGTKEQANDRK
jgi:hypothetical protein